MSRRLLAGLLLVLAGLADAAAPEPTVQDWLNHMAQSAKTLNYQGDLVYVHGGEVSNLRLTHVRDGEQEWEHLVKVDGHGAEVLRGSNGVIFRNPKGSATRLSLPALARPRKLAQHLGDLQQFYISSITAGSQIAGHKAVRISLKPRDQDRYGYEFYADKATGLMLKSVMLDQAGKPLEAISFSSLKIGPTVGLEDYQAARQAEPASHPAPTAPAVSAAVVPRRGPRPAPSAASAPAAPAASSGIAVKPPETLDWQLWMPAGFVQLGPVRHKRINGAAIVLATFSDGLASFSFFSERLATGKLPAESQHLRGTTAYVSRQRVAGDKAWLVTVVGELPLSVAQHIADSAVLPGMPLPVTASAPVLP
jgi:sigma-E factor negative regulatory protein RseB